MTSNLDLTFHGVNGGRPNVFNNRSSIKVCVDYDATNDRRIYFDAFYGEGSEFRRRKETLINIYDKAGKPVFYGTFDELVEKLKSK